MTSDGELARAARAGSPSALAELLQRHHPALLRFLRGRLHSEHDAEDLAQEALLRACQHIDDYDSGRPFSPWLMTIAANLAVSHARARRPAENLEHAQPCAPAEYGPEQRAIALERSHRLWRLAEASLPRRQYEVLWLRYSGDCSVREIAAKLGLTQIHVKVLLFRARGKLMKLATQDLGQP